MKFELYEDEAGEWRWRLIAGNHEIIAVSGEGYTRREDAARAIGRVQDAVFDIGRQAIMRDAETAANDVAAEDAEDAESP